MVKLSDDLLKLFAEAKVIVTLGAGGVGKTTCSVATALLGAAQGKRVGLLSIDPAKRLAKAMGLDFSSQFREVELPAPFNKGSLKAAMLDQKAVFDEMVHRYTKSEKTRQRIFANQLYQMVSRNLGGPLEYMALAKLEQMHSSGEFDLLVLDTPPDTHAIDFLMRPNILSGFMDNKVMTWLIKPFHIARRLGAGKLLLAGEKLMGGIATVTGISALNTLAEFLVLMEDVISGFHSSGLKISSILRRPDTIFTLVTVPTPAALRSSEHLIQQLHQEHFVLKAAIINKLMPTELKAAASDFPLSNASAVLKDRIQRIQKQLNQEETIVGKVVKAIHSQLENPPQIILAEEQSHLPHEILDIGTMMSKWTPKIL